MVNFFPKIKFMSRKIPSRIEYVTGIVLMESSCGLREGNFHE